MMPWEFAGLSSQKKAALIGMIRVRVDAEKKAQAQAKVKSRKK
ncbi:hypothetical protein [Cohnella sp. GCM10012308]